MSKGSPVVLIAIILVALGALAFLNSAMQPKDPQAEQKAAQEKAAKAVKDSGKSAQSTADELMTPGGGNELVALGDDAVVGDPKGAKEVVIGYSWTPAVQNNPAKIYSLVQQARKELKGVRIRVVNVDANPDVGMGISIAGKTVCPPDPDGGYSDSAYALKSIRGGLGVKATTTAAPL
jgi:hypothetical protein